MLWRGSDKAGGWVAAVLGLPACFPSLCLLGGLGVQHVSHLVNGMCVELSVCYVGSVLCHAGQACAMSMVCPRWAAVCWKVSAQALSSRLHLHRSSWGRHPPLSELCK